MTKSNPQNPDAPFVICPAGVRDVRATYRLEREVFPLDAYPYFDLLLLFLSPGTITLKAVSPEDTLVGFVCGSRTWTGLFPAWIITLGVITRYQRQGIGAALLQACEERLRAHKIRLTVRTGNQPAISLYDRQGYVQVGIRRNYYLDGEDGIVMEKRFP